jgi:hypothetical protein
MTRRIRTTLLLGATALGLGVAGTADAATYHGYVGPGSTIRLLNSSGNVVRRVPVGRHRFVIHDNSSSHNFVLRRGSVRLLGTSVSGTGVIARRVRIRAGRHVYFCAPHAGWMRGGFRGV